MTIYGFTRIPYTVEGGNDENILYSVFETIDNAPPEYALVEATSPADALVILISGGPLLRPAVYKNPAPKPKNELVLLRELLDECDDLLNRITVMEDEKQRSKLRWTKLAAKTSAVRNSFGIERDYEP